MIRELLSFECQGDCLAGSLDRGESDVGVLIVTGGTQTRIGSHRMFERLALALAAKGHSCFRFDRRGVGDSSGADPDFRGNADDLAAAVGTFRSTAPDVKRLIGFGLCDGASSLALHGAGNGFDGLILVNPWVVEAEADAPPPAAIRQHYRQRLLSVEGWKKILTGSISYRKLLHGLIKIARPAQPSGLAADMASGLAAVAAPIELILARGDATAIAAADAWKSPPFARLIQRVPVHATTVETDSHTFSRPGDMEKLEQTILAALERLGRSGRD